MLLVGVNRVWVVAVRRKHRACAQIAEMIRVDHAGEFGADRIYAGQLAILSNSPAGPKIKEMWEQEKEHRAKFEELLYERRVRPTFFLPLWHVAGFMLGAGSALLGEKGAMACTVAVESVIVDHYNDQLRTLSTNQELFSSVENQALCETIKKFRDDEQEHHDTGIQYGALEAPFYDTLTGVIKTICRIAIEVSKKA